MSGMKNQICNTHKVIRWSFIYHKTNTKNRFKKPNKKYKTTYRVLHYPSNSMNFLTAIFLHPLLTPKANLHNCLPNNPRLRASYLYI